MDHTPALTDTASPSAAAASEHDERALVAAARAGSREAWGAIWKRYGAAVHGVLLARGKSAADADDLTQEVFIRAAREIGSLRDDGRLGAWLAAIARNAAASQGRSAWRAGLRLVGLGGRVSEPARDADCGEEARRVLTAIRELPEAYQEPLVLRLVEGLTGPQIAASLGMTHGSVRVNLSKGMVMLKECLKTETTA